jgi:hypothetical protein
MGILAGLDTLGNELDLLLLLRYEPQIFQPIV